MTPDLAEQNAESAYWYAIGKDSPGKLWWNAELWHDATGRALSMSRHEYGGVYALSPFRLGRVDGRAVVLAAYPSPRLFNPPSEDWLDIEAVIAWDPLTDHATILGDANAQLVGSFEHDAALYSSPRRFFQRWAQKRAAFAAQRQMATGKDWSSPPTELDLAPGMLIIGKPEEVRWNTYPIPRDLECIDVDAKLINRLIIRSANLPRPFQRAA